MSKKKYMDVTPKPYKIGLALSGGGAKGFAHLGAFKLLEETGLKPDIISGTSAGSLMGVLFADGYSAEEIKSMFIGREFSDFAQIQVPKSGLFDTERFQDFLERQLRTKLIEDLPIPMVIVATDLDNGISHEFRSGPIVEAVTASCCMPIIFKPIEINKVHYVDGGLFRNFPVSTIRDECEHIIGVNVSPLIPQRYKQTLLHIAERTYHYVFQANAVEDRELCDVLIEAKEVALYKTFDLENINSISELGYQAAVKAFMKVINDNKNKKFIKVINSYSPPKSLLT